MMELPAISTARVPDNYLTAEKALKQLDRLTRRLAKQRLPSDPAGVEAELLAWKSVLSRDLSHRTCAIQARAIRGCGGLMKELEMWR